MASGWCASGDGVYSTNAMAARAPTASSRTSRSWVAALPSTQPPPCMYTTTGSVPVVPCGFTIRTRTAPTGEGHCDPVLVDWLLVDRLGLEVLQDLACCGRLQLIQERGCRGCVCELLGSRFENDGRSPGSHRCTPLERVMLRIRYI